jgi:predicted AlkP superfamily phosphohydrolase/phosphomutase
VITKEVTMLFRGRSRAKRVFVVGIDGTPYSFLKRCIEAKDLPNMALLAEQGSFRRMNSVIPTVSCVAWSSFMTGTNPGKHAIFGFQDRRPQTYETYIPLSTDQKGRTLWEVLSEHRKRVVVINVPETFPPRQVNGVLVSGFLTPDLKKGVYPPDKLPLLEQMGYRIDVDPWKGREDDKGPFLEDLNATLDARTRSAFKLMESEPWDFFMVLVMGTDRINHFLWEHMETGHPTYAPAFLDYYRKIDRFIGQLMDCLDDQTTLVVLSDHGFCTVKQEVYVNHFLEQQGWLRFRAEGERLKLNQIHEDSIAYSLDPGRIYIHLQGREGRGRVAPGSEYERIRDELATSLGELKEPRSGEPMIDRVYRREELFTGSYAEHGPDLVMVPIDGYDLKGAFGKQDLVHKGNLVGMHTYDDASVFIRGQEIVKQDLSILDIFPTILHTMDLSLPEGLDGAVCVRR